MISPTVEKLLSLAVIVSGAVAEDMEVYVFLSFSQVAFKKGMPEKFDKIGKDYEEYKQTAVNYMMEKKVSWYSMLKDAKSTGKVKIDACSLVADMLKLKKEDFDPLVDNISGVGTFLNEASKSDVVLYI
jgi:peroxiredoxin family protein